jgi:hypothetical protein
MRILLGQNQQPVISHLYVWSYRCLYLAQSYSAGAKFAEAYTLFNRALQYCENFKKLDAADEVCVMDNLYAFIRMMMRLSGLRSKCHPIKLGTFE